MSSRFAGVLAAGLVASLGLACTQRPDAAPGAPADPGPPAPGAGETGTIVLALTTVPADVHCLRVIAAGSETVTRTFVVTPNGSAMLTMGGLPLGLVTFTESAYDAECDQLVASTPATWVSAMPVSATLVPGQQTMVSIVLRRPGGASITNDFQTVASLSALPSSRNFGNVVVGTASAPQMFSISNAVGAPTSGPLTVTLSGPQAADFSILSNGCTQVLLSGQTCDVAVVFTPGATGARAAQLTVTDTVATVVVPLTGVGLQPAALLISPATHAFGQVPVGTGSQAAFMITNPGQVPTGPLAVAITGVDAASFVITSNSCTVLAPGNNCGVNVSFAPSTIGAKAAALTVTGAPGGTATATLTGQGISPGSLTITPASANFGVVVAGTQSPPTAFTVTNPSTAPVSALAAVLSTADFAVAANTCAGVTLVQNQTCTVSVVFAPPAAATGPRMGNLTVTGFAGGGQTSVVAALSGTAGVGAQIEVIPPSANFGDVPVGTVVVRNFTVRNTGMLTSGPLSVTVAGGGSLSFSLTSNNTCNGATVAPGASCTFEARFAPVMTGAQTGAINVSVAGMNLAPVTLAGTGVGAVLAISPTSENLGNVELGLTASRTFVVTNTGSVASPPLLASLMPTTDFTLDPTVAANCNGATLAALATCNVKVVFAPSALNLLRSTTLSVASPNPAISVAAAVQGTGVASTWSTIDIGGPALLGTFNPSGGVFAIQGGGADIWGGADQFKYAYKHITGNATLTAQVMTVQLQHAWTKAVVMMREGLTGNARYVGAVVSPTPGNFYRLQARTSVGGGTSSIPGGTGVLPVWFRLVRAGNIITASFSMDNSTWTPLGAPQTLAGLQATLQIGLAVTSHNTNALALVNFENVSITQP